MNEQLQQLGRRVDLHHQRLRGDGAARRQAQLRERVLEHQQQKLQASAPSVHKALLAASVAIAIVLAVVVIGRSRNDDDHRAPSRPAPLYTVKRGTEVKRGVAGAWVSAGDQETVISFSAGSSIALSSGRGRVRITRSPERRVSVALEGAARFDLADGAATSWQVSAGPYRVKVASTRFEAAWDASSKTFELTALRGSARVSGPGVAAGKTLAAGQRLRLDAGSLREPSSKRSKRQESLRSIRAARPAAGRRRYQRSTRAEGLVRRTVRRRSPSRRQVVRREPAVVAPTRRRAARPNQPRHAPTQLARQGRYCEAISAARRLGWPTLLRQAPASELLVLGNAARLCADARSALEVYQRIRRRFPRSRAATTAAFGMGQIAFDLQQAYQEAARWFRVYLGEAANGPLAREATGRLFEALQRNGQPDAACRMARQYLKRFPGGPHARQARRSCGRRR